MSETPRRSDARLGAGVLTAVIVGLSLLFSVPAWFTAGPTGLRGLIFAAVLCLLPGWVVFAILGLYKSAKSRAFGVLAGAGIRFAVAIAGVLWVKTQWSEDGWQAFLVWMAVLYPICLVVETILILRQTSDQSTIGSGGTEPDYPPQNTEATDGS
ncbi:hypothetical protein [Stratiformator vulcanicus]|uniref:ATP synthase protein I n=1 Tax=Stratiformator vulcanicus TaxID=2527980 RepID=A0A517R1I3_9PLAN|nr:hypothetical protein [Stratiformator vulcanicus]QDT37726.1 hypothetical protein Pan189_21080 [Stratiformator vulcanicus]